MTLRAIKAAGGSEAWEKLDDGKWATQTGQILSSVIMELGEATYTVLSGQEKAEIDLYAQRTELSEGREFMHDDILVFLRNHRTNSIDESRR